MQTDDLPEILKVSEAASYLRLTEDELINELENGKILGVKIAGKWRIQKAALRDFLGLSSIGEGGKNESPNKEITNNIKPPQLNINTGEAANNKIETIFAEPLERSRGHVISFNTNDHTAKVRMDDERVVYIDSEMLKNIKGLPFPGDLIEFELIQNGDKLKARSISIISKISKIPPHAITLHEKTTPYAVASTKRIDKVITTPKSNHESGKTINSIDTESSPKTSSSREDHLESIKPNQTVLSSQSAKMSETTNPKSTLNMPKPDISAADLFTNGKKEFTNGNVKKALEYLEQAYQHGERNPQIFLFLGQTLQRLEGYEKAHKYLDIGIRVVKSSEQRLSLLNVKAQIHSSQGQLEKAAKTYEQLMKLEKRPNARRFINLQLVRLYRSLDEIDKAKIVVNQLIQEYPQDQVTIRLKAAIEQPTVTKPPEVSSADDTGERELQVDLPEVDLISPMLKQDLAIAEYRDEKILRQGGRPEVNDADRILQEAEKEKGTEFGERYPVFLEAAKAYSELPEGSYTLENFYRALARYAMLKGGALVSRFQLRAISGRTNLRELCHLRDSATSYYLESLAIQMNLDAESALIALSNYIRAQIVYALVRRKESTPSGIFEWSFSDLFRFCLEHKDQEITNIAYSAVISWGAAGSDIWNRLQTLGGTGVVTGTLFKRNTRIRPYRVLSAISGQSFTIDQRPGEVLRTLFLERRHQQQDIQQFFTRLQHMSLDIRNSRELQEHWKSLPLYRGALLDTDFEIHEGISSILATLQPYQTRSPEERAAILFTVRTSIEHLHDFIEANPTYWGRVGFDPLLTLWQSVVRNAEEQRLEEIQPRFIARLEPPVFHLEGEFVTGGVNIHNVGRATAEGVVIGIELRGDSDEEILLKHEEEIKDEIAVDKTYYHALRFPISTLSQGRAEAYRLQVQITPIFRQMRLDTTLGEFTLQVQSGPTFSKEEIPWNELAIPPKHLFKGREKFIRKLIDHLVSLERNRTYILYGLTRTGKSSILTYLGQQLDHRVMDICGEPYRIISFTWNFGEAKSHSNASDMWGYLLYEQVISKLERLVKEGEIGASSVPTLRSDTHFRYRDWGPILNHLYESRLYPVFLIDEFSYYRSLVDSNRIDASFLAAIRTIAIEGKGSFVIAGTYDLKNLMKDPAYGITGQFVNAIETQVSRIDQAPAEELIKVLEPKLRFSEDAVTHILHLSYRIPYFIQMLCRNCALYALNSERNIIGFPEVEAVVNVLTTGNADDPHLINIERIPPGGFMNNMYTPSDPPEYGALISTIASLTSKQLIPHKVTYPEIQETWDRHGVRFFQSRLALAIKELCGREILNSSDDEGLPAYQISVDLFRRWWSHEHKDMQLELDALKQED